MIENEIEVPSMKAAKEFLEALGYSHKSYQEKRRGTYLLQRNELDIDTWPRIPTYLEFEGESEEKIEEIPNLLEYTMEDTISCTADEIYQKYGENMIETREVKFN